MNWRIASFNCRIRPSTNKCWIRGMRIRCPASATIYLSIIQVRIPEVYKSLPQSVFAGKDQTFAGGTSPVWNADTRETGVEDEPNMSWPTVVDSNDFLTAWQPELSHSRTSRSSEYEKRFRCFFFPSRNEAKTPAYRLTCVWEKQREEWC